tara:strand:+ start:116 stop:895 length:780 start_codon:yes stop_codon:yes gene_type:complete
MFLKEESLKKKLVIIVPYRNRPEQLKIFQFHSKIYFNEDKMDKHLNLKLCFIEQANEKPFNYGRLSNAGYLIYEDYLDYLVVNNVDFLPMIADYSYCDHPLLLIKHGHNNLPMRPTKNSNWIVKGTKRENFFGNSVLIPKHVFKKVNGYSNSYWGWGYEDTDLRKRIEVNNIDVGYRDGFYHPLLHDNLGFNINEKDEAVPSESHLLNKKKFDENWKNRDNYLNDGINNLKFEIRSNEEIYSNLRNEKLFEIRHIKIDF